MSRNKLFLLILTIMLSVLTPIAAYAKDTDLTNKECLSCHGKTGHVINWFTPIDAETYKQSIHGTYACTTCHTDIKSVPHTKASFGEEYKAKIYERCSACHDKAKKDFTQSAHFREINCGDCHGKHDIRKLQDEKSSVNRVNISNVCMKCHDGEVKHAYMESFHGKANHLGSIRAASCADCHGSHSILGPDDPKSRVSKENTPKTCAICHLQARANFANGLEHTTLENKPGSAPMYWTLKFFIWLTIIVITLLFIHMEMELYRILKETKEGEV